ncbi:MAG: hypothetical protein AMJ59_24915 [Gammaproteobacteria bacterium SG8_31]|nr:MAG: hypothetical protein AMJ59_24915 [Gammaproteobacteria bacterium SG8_31]
MARRYFWLIWAWRYRFVILGAYLALTATALWSARDVRVDNSPVSWVLNDASLTQEYRWFRDRFGSDAFVVVAFRAEHPFWNADNYEKLQDVNERLCTLPGIHACVSLTAIDAATIRFISASEDRRTFLVDPRDEHPAQRKDRLLSDPLIAPRLLSEDGRWALTLLNLDSRADDLSDPSTIVGDIDRTLASGPLQYALTGPSVIYSALNELSRDEIRRLFALSAIVIVVLMAVIFRRAAPVLATFAAVCVSVSWMFGFIGLAGYSVNVLSSIAPTVVLVIGVSDCVHTLMHAAEQPGNLSAEDRIAAGIGPMVRPCFLTTLTTMIGFGSLVATGLPMTAELGVMVAVGVVGAFVCGMFACVVVAGYGLLPAAPAIHERFSRWSLATVRAGLRLPRAMLCMALVLVTISVGYSFDIRVDGNPLEQLPADHRVRRDAALVEQHFPGTSVLDFVITGSTDSSSAQTLRHVALWEESALQREQIQWSLSETSGIKRANQLLNGMNVDEFRLPDEDNDLNRARWVHKLIAPHRQEAFRTKDGDMRVTFGVSDVSAIDLRKTISEILALASFSPETIVHPVGLISTWAEQFENLVGAQIRSFAWAFVFVTLILVAIARTRRLIFVAVIANSLPVILVLGLTGFLEIQLDLGTVAVVSVVLGLVIDNTIHFIHRLRVEIHDRPNNTEAAIEETGRTAGRSIFMASVILSTGFATLVFARIDSVAWFGILISAALFMALLADLLIGPSVLKLSWARSDT